MADIKVVTLGGELLDALVHKHYGDRAGALQAVLDANPKLASHGPVLPAGVNIALPSLPPIKTSKGITLWD